MAIKSLFLAALLAAANAQMTTLTIATDSLTSVVSLPVWPSPSTTTTTTETDTVSSGMTTTTTYVTPFLPAPTTSTTTTTANVTATVVSSTTTSVGSASNSTTTGSGAAESSVYLSSVLSVETYTPTPVGGTNATGTGAPSQYTGAAAPKAESKGSAWIAMVAFGVVGLMVL